jgi:hypothetical protein
MVGYLKILDISKSYILVTNTVNMNRYHYHYYPIIAFTAIINAIITITSDIYI